jgi:hypothetical protein
MNFPFWKARFEVLGSWFMTKTIEQTISQNQATETLNGTGDNGGVIAFRMEGATQIRPNMTVGLHARYSYQEFIGKSLMTTGVAGAAISPFKLYYNENVLAIGVDVGVAF